MRRLWVLAVGGLVIALSGSAQAKAPCSLDAVGFCVKPLVAHRHVEQLEIRHVGPAGAYFTAGDGTQFLTGRRDGCAYYARHSGLRVTVRYCIGEPLIIRYHAPNKTPFAFHWATVRG